MWLFFKSLFMIKGPAVAKEMVAAHMKNNKTRSLKGFKLARLMRRRNRRQDFSAHNTTQLKSRVR